MSIPPLLNQVPLTSHLNVHNSSTVQPVGHLASSGQVPEQMFTYVNVKPIGPPHPVFGQTQ